MTSVMRGKVREPVVVSEQRVGESGHMEKSVKVLKTQPSVKERMAAAEMLARRYGILDDGGSGSGVEFYGEEKFADGGDEMTDIGVNNDEA